MGLFFYRCRTRERDAAPDAVRTPLFVSRYGGAPGADNVLQAPSSLPGIRELAQCVMTETVECKLAYLIWVYSVHVLESDDMDMHFFVRCPARKN